MKPSLPVVVEMNRRLIAGYVRYKEEPRVIQLRKAVSDYNLKLKTLGIKDHQVEWGDVKQRTRWLTLLIFLYRIGQIVTLGIATLPSLALFWPVFVTREVITARKQRKALAAYLVKLEGRDVVGSWKIIVAMSLAPMLYIWYTFVVTLWLHHCRQNGYYATLAPWWIRVNTYVPNSISLKVFSTAFSGFIVAITFAGLRTGEIGVDIIKSLPPLFIALSPRPAITLSGLRLQRQSLSARVVEVIDALRPEIFPDLDVEKLTTGDHHDEGTYQSELKSMPPSEPETATYSRIKNQHGRKTNNDGFGIYPYYGSFKLPTIASKGDLEEVSRTITDPIHRTVQEPELGRSTNFCPSITEVAGEEGKKEV